MILASDNKGYGGSGYKRQKLVTTEGVDCGGWHESLEITLPPLSAMVLAPKR